MKAAQRKTSAGWPADAGHSRGVTLQDANLAELFERYGRRKILGKMQEDEGKGEKTIPP